MNIALDWGPVASGKYKKAKRLFKAGDYIKSAELLAKDIGKKPNKFGYYALGKCFVVLQDYEKASQSFIQAVNIDQSYHEAFDVLGDVYFFTGQRNEGFGCLVQAVKADPANVVYMQKLVNMASRQEFNSVDLVFKETLAECMKSDQVSLNNLGRAWLSMVELDVETGPYLALSKHEDYRSFKKEMGGFTNCDGLVNSFFLTGVSKIVVPSHIFERWMKHLRRYFLESIMEGNNLFSDQSDMQRVICAMASYCFSVDYVISCTSKEEQLLGELEQKINGAGANPDLTELVCFGCYKPLHLLPKAKEIAAEINECESYVLQIFKAQIEDYFVQQNIREEIETLGKIEDETSKAVREQYEVFPYPRWSVAVKDMFNPQIEGAFTGKKAEILIGGCGTGKEAIQMAYTFPDAQITAVDLSKTSLAYAISKAREFGVKNIKFYQADIMGLTKIEDWQGRFDYIASGGVLHHMKDPKAGWKVFCGLLKERGVMRIGLYTHIGRQAISAARVAIEDKGIDSDGEAIKLFRDEIDTHLDETAVEKLQSMPDFYNLSECRDLLFHVQEHQFTFGQIKEHLDELDLSFMRLYLKRRVWDEYVKQYGSKDPQGTDLEVWDRFERENPGSFASMYVFWCRKNG